MSVKISDISNEFAIRPSRFTDLSALSAAYPGVSLAELCVATVAQTLNPDFKDLLVPYLNNGGTAKGRSTTMPSMPAAPEPEEEFFLRPNGEKYFPRSWGEMSDVKVLHKARETKQAVFLYGAPGCGKTALADAAFPDLHVVLGTGDTEVADFVGGFVQTPSGEFLWVDGPLVKAAETGGVLLIDEVGLVDPKVMSVVYSLMDGRQELTVTANPERGTVKAKDGFFVIAATNPNAPGVRLSEALLSRFSIHAEMTTDWDRARKLGVPTTIVSAAQNMAQKVLNNDLSWAPQFRELLAFRDLTQTFGQKFAIANLLASAPEQDRAVVIELLTRAYGADCRPAKI